MESAFIEHHEHTAGPKQYTLIPYGACTGEQMYQVCKKPRICCTPKARRSSTSFVSRRRTCTIPNSWELHCSSRSIIDCPLHCLPRSMIRTHRSRNRWCSENDIHLGHCHTVAHLNQLDPHQLTVVLILNASCAHLVRHTSQYHPLDRSLGATL